MDRHQQASHIKAFKTNAILPQITRKAFAATHIDPRSRRESIRCHQIARKLKASYLLHHRGSKASLQTTGKTCRLLVPQHQTGKHLPLVAPLIQSVICRSNPLSRKS